MMHIKTHIKEIYPILYPTPHTWYISEHIKNNQVRFCNGYCGISVACLVYTLIHLISRNVYLWYKQYINGDNKVYALFKLTH